MNKFILEAKSSFSAIATMLLSRKHLAITLGAGAAMAVFVWLLPFFINPNLTWDSQVDRIGVFGIGLFVVFSFLVGATIGMNSFASSLQRQGKKLAGNSLGTGTVGVIGGLFSGPLCISCISVGLSALGLSGSVSLFLFSYSWAITALSFVVLLAALYFSTQRVKKVCVDCSGRAP